MKIWIVSDGEPLPTDSDNVRLRRMGNLTRILDQQGHKVVWFSSNFDHYNKNFAQKEIKYRIYITDQNYCYFLQKAIKECFFKKIFAFQSVWTKI